MVHRAHSIKELHYADRLRAVLLAQLPAAERNLLKTLYPRNGVVALDHVELAAKLGTDIDIVYELEERALEMLGFHLITGTGTGSVHFETALDAAA